MISLTPEQANDIYDILVERAGAYEADRDDFVLWQTKVHAQEYRFMGSLGFGGKFWNGTKNLVITCYPEDETPERIEIIKTVNDLLAAYVLVNKLSP